MKKMQAILKKIRRGVFLTVAILLVMAGSAYGADSLNVPTITPLTEGQLDRLNKKPGIPGARNGFVERFGDAGSIVISDTSRQLTSDARFYRGANGNPIFLNEIQVGTYVGYTMNDKAEIDLMWIAE
jgi:hypothetical protein